MSAFHKRIAQVSCSAHCVRRSRRQAAAVEIVEPLTTPRRSTPPVPATAPPSWIPSIIDGSPIPAIFLCLTYWGRAGLVVACDVDAARARAQRKTDPVC